MTGNLATAGRKRHPRNRRRVETDEPRESEFGRGGEIGETGWGVASDRVNIVRHAEKNLCTVGDAHPKECLRSFDDVGPLFGAPCDTVFKLEAPRRDCKRRTGEIRTVGRDLIRAGRTIRSVSAGSGHKKTQGRPKLPKRRSDMCASTTYRSSFSGLSNQSNFSQLKCRDQCAAVGHDTRAPRLRVSPVIKPIFDLGPAQASTVRKNDVDTRWSRREVSEDLLSQQDGSAR